MVTSDLRLLRGARTRQAITRHAVEVASVEGLTGLSIGRLAADLGLSKSGVQTLFGTKEKLQVATIEAARDAFVDAVVRPALTAPHGVDRLRALIEHWISYAEAPLFEGGCFWTANLADFDSRPGEVRDALFGHHQNWLALLSAELRHAGYDDDRADLVAFQVNAVLMAANIALRLGDTSAAGKVRSVVNAFLDAARR